MRRSLLLLCFLLGPIWGLLGQVVVSVPEPQGVLVLFPGFGGNASTIQAEFPIAEAARQQSWAVVYMDFNQHLHLEDAEYAFLTHQLDSLFDHHGLPKGRVAFGGFSSGGNVAVLLAAHLHQRAEGLAPAQVFVVDSPLDLARLYQLAASPGNGQLSEAALAERRYLKAWFETTWGTPEAAPEKYRKYSPVWLDEAALANLLPLAAADLRLYAEPDSAWWQRHGVSQYEALNAWTLKQLFQLLVSDYGWHQVAYITTTGRGYRADGTRHPHSWSIVDPAELMLWLQRADD